MTSPTRSIPDASTAQVVAAIAALGDGGFDAVLAAVSRQVYGPQRIVVVGGTEQTRTAVESRDGVEWASDLRTLLDGLDREVTHLWLLHDDVRPRPDALKALVEESIRVDSSVAGSKLLDADHPEVLESVGGATDVFGIPYTGLEEGEVDQEQYDVVRDVAFTPGASMLVRRDLLRGLRGPDAVLPPFEAGIDFSQRARSSGGRVVVVPSSEVLHAPSCGRDEPAWKSRAGRMRAALKVYSLLTLVWLVPVGAAIDLLDAVVRLAIGPRRTAFDVLQAWLWNLVNLPSTVSARRAMGRSRQVGDAELFRYQVRGSSILRRLGDDLTEAVRGPTISDGASAISGLVARGRQVWQQPGVIIGVIGLLLVLIAGRSIVTGRLPSTGYALHLPESALETLRAYSGGWNPADLGNTRPLHPSIGAAGLVQWLVFGNAGLAEMLLTVGGAFLIFTGTSRLLRMLGAGSGGRFVAGVVAVAGPATFAMSEAGLWTGLPALAALPFAVAAPLRPWPQSFRSRVGRIASDAFPVAVLAAFAPVAIVVPLVATVVWFVVGVDRRWTSTLRSAVSVIIALPVLAPWIIFIDPAFLIEAGRPYFWDPPLWVVVAFGVAVGFSLLAGESRTAAAAGWGGVLALGGAAAARTAEIGAGLEPALAGLITAALGTSIVAGVAVDSLRPIHGSWRRAAALPGLLAGVALAVTFVFSVADGALGLGEDRFADPFVFTSARAADYGAARVLVVGDPADLPGDSRSSESINYRLFRAPEPTMLDARLHPALEGERALSALLTELGSGENLRPGEQLARFGIRWVVFTGPSPLEGAFAAKLDVKPLPLPEFEAVYENLVDSPIAATASGDAWQSAGAEFTGATSDERVRIAVNAAEGWRPDPAASEWAVTVTGSEGRAYYEADGGKAVYAWVAAGLLLVLAVAGVAGRSRRT